MKIYLIGNTKEEIARSLTDKHVYTLTKFYAEVLVSLHTEKTYLGDLAFNKLKANHNVYNWVSESKQNYIWLYELFVAVATEYKLRYNKDHMSYINLNRTLVKVPKLPDVGLTAYKHNIPKKYLLSNELDTHRNYYANEKIRFATWRPPSEVPSWIINFKR